MHEGCDRGGYYEQAQFAEEYGSPLCIVKLGCWGPVVQCNVGKRGWMAGIGGCPNVGGICIGCTMPGFPDKFMPFMNQPPGSLLSSAAVQTYGRAIHALRRFTLASLNKEPSMAEKACTLRATGMTPGLLSCNGRRAPNMRRLEYEMSSFARTAGKRRSGKEPAADASDGLPDIAEAEAILLELARVFGDSVASATDAPNHFTEKRQETAADQQAPNLEAKYRALLEQIPAVVFMAYLDRGISEAYVSPQIEAALGYSREEWLEDPVRWYQHIHADDKQRWSLEAAEMFLSGKPLRSSYRVIARDGRVIWFHCDARDDAEGRRSPLVHSRRRI